MTLRERVPLAPFCTLGVGGPARFFLEAHEEEVVLEGLEWSRRRRLPCRILGAGSNLVVADRGVDGLVIRNRLRGVSVAEGRGVMELTAAAGEPWDDVVGLAVDRNWAGLECLSGIPGLVGATPIQNVGAYGQEVSDTVIAVRAVDTRDGRLVTLSRAECGFAYRDSRFKSGEPGRHVVLSVTYRLRPGGAPTVRYADLEAHLARRGIGGPTLGQVRESVLAIRRAKSMVRDPGDPNQRSCGSFFLNPIVTAEECATVESRALDPAMPRWPLPGGRVKLSAAWLIERAGFPRGTREGPVGLSTRHALAIVAHEGARASDVVALARRLQNAVEERFGVRVVPEPDFWGLG